MSEKHEPMCECLKCTDYLYTSVYYGLKEGEFSELDEDKKKKLRKFIARISESAYRRGVQQAIVLKESERRRDWIYSDLGSYRYDISLDESPDLVKPCMGFSSLRRLCCEVNLDQVGL